MSAVRYGPADIRRLPQGGEPGMRNGAGIQGRQAAPDNACRITTLDEGPSKVTKFRNGHGKPVVALDIDGPFGDYHRHFLNFAELYFDRPMPDPKAINPGLHLSEHMRVSKPEYREAKLAYRQGGFKRWMPAYDGATELTDAIRSLGAEVWITTTR